MIHFFFHALLKNIDEDISINVDLSDTPEEISVSTMKTSTISKTEMFIDNVYDKTVKSKLKKDFIRMTTQISR